MASRHGGAVATNDGQPDSLSTDSVASPAVDVQWLTQRQLASYLQCSIATLARLRPPRHLLGASPRYSKIEIDAWLASRSGGAP